jgi:hypothetical protein
MTVESKMEEEIRGFSRQFPLPGGSRDVSLSPLKLCVD